MNKLLKKSAEWPFVAALAILWAYFHSRVLFGGETFVLEDSSRFFFPLWKWGAEVWAKGWIPLWNPDAAFGTPYLADPQMACWYPPIFIAYHFLDPVSAFNGLISGHHLWAMLGLWFFARAKGCDPWLSFSGSLIYGFSFNALSLGWACTMLFAYAWIPWVFLAADGIARRNKNAILIFSIVLSLQLAAGYPLFFYLTLLTLFFDRTLQFVFSNEPRLDRKREAVWLLSGAVLAIGYNAAWLIPFREFIPFSNLAQRAAFSQSLAWSDLGSWFNPFLKGHPLHSNPETSFSVTVFFSGLPLLVLLFWGIVKRNIKYPLMVLFFLSTILSLGGTVGVGEWLKSLLPGYYLVVRSGYWIPFVIWIGIRMFLEAGNKITADDAISRGSSVPIWLLIGSCVYGSALLLGVPWDLGSFWLSFALLLLVILPGSKCLPFRGFFLALSVFFSLFPAAQSLNFTMSKNYYQSEPLVLKGIHEPGRIYQSSRWVDGSKGISGKSVAEAYEGSKEGCPPNWPLLWDKEEISFGNSLFLSSFLKWYLWMDHADPRKERGLLNFLNARYEIGPPILKPGRNGVGGEKGEVFVENKSCFPKWFSVEKALPPPGQDQDAMLLDPFFDLGKKCFVDDPQNAGPFGFRKVRELSRSPNQVDLSAEGSRRALLVSSESAYPGWVASVNGKKKPTQCIDRAFRGVLLEEGENQVHLTYNPASFRLGCFLSMLVCALWAGMLLKKLRNDLHA